MIVPFRCRRYSAPLLAVTALLVPVLSFAQDSAPGEEGAPAAAHSEPASNEGNNKSGNRKTGNGGKATGADERFTPSEEISEDLSVPFPVDI